MTVIKRGVRYGNWSLALFSLALVVGCHTLDERTADYRRSVDANSVDSGVVLRWTYGLDHAATSFLVERVGTDGRAKVVANLSRDLDRTEFRWRDDFEEPGRAGAYHYVVTGRGLIDEATLRSESVETLPPLEARLVAALLRHDVASIRLDEPDDAAGSAENDALSDLLERHGIELLQPDDPRPGAARVRIGVQREESLEYSGYYAWNRVRVRQTDTAELRSNGRVLWRGEEIVLDVRLIRIAGRD